MMDSERTWPQAKDISQQEDRATREEPMTKIQWDEDVPHVTRIKVIGVGGGGCNAVEDMVNKGFGGVEFYGVNTDYQALQCSSIPNKIQIGDEITHGLGAGAIPELGEEAARSAEAHLRSVLEGADMIFITAGMGGGTGTGAAPVVAEIAKSLDILTVAIVTKPFTFEGPQRMRRAIKGIENLKQSVDTSIVIMNDKLMETVGPKTPLTEAFQVVNGVLAQGIRAISDLISMPGLINVDFRDVRTIMGETGGAVMGVGIGKGENRASEAVKKACHSPLQEKIVIDGARGVLINITGGVDITMAEITEATSLVYEAADPDANIIFGVVVDERMKDEMRVTIIATGFSEAAESNLSSFGGAQPVKSRLPEFKHQGSTMSVEKPAIYQAPAAEPIPQQPAAPARPTVEEPNPIPALQRKQEQREAPQAPKLTVDFGHHDNPLKDWDEPLKSAPAAPEAQELPPVNPTQTPYNPVPSSYSQAGGYGQPAPSQSAHAFGEAPQASEPEDQSGDPLDIPALMRRRKHHLFE